MRRTWTVTLRDGGNAMPVTLEDDFDRPRAILEVDGIPHYFERIKRSDLMRMYLVDRDPDYRPKTDRRGHCYLLVPCSK